MTISPLSQPPGKVAFSAVSAAKEVKKPYVVRPSEIRALSRAVREDAPIPQGASRVEALAHVTSRMLSELVRMQTSANPLAFEDPKLTALAKAIHQQPLLIRDNKEWRRRVLPLSFSEGAKRGRDSLTGRIFELLQWHHNLNDGVQGELWRCRGFLISPEKGQKAGSEWSSTYQQIFRYFKSRIKRNH